ncbi:MAG: oligosaccharide flippase family protein [Thermoleophilaceae bacterium]
MTSVSRAHAARDVLIGLAGRLLNLGLGLVVVILIARTLGVAGSGTWASLLAVTTIAGTLADLGIEQVAVRRMAADPDDEPDVLGALLVIRTALAVVVMLGAFAACVLLVEGEVVAGALVSATVLAAAPQTLRAAFQVRVRNDRTIAVLTFNSVIWAAAVIAIAALDGGLVAFAAAFLATTLMTTALAVTWVLRIAKIAFDRVRRHARELLAVGLVVGLGLTLTAAYGRIAQLLVLELDGERGAGLYAAAFLLVERAQVAPMAVMATLYPLISAAWPRDPDRAGGLVERGLDLMTIVSLPALGFTLVASEPLVELLYGDDFRAAADLLPILTASFVLVCWGYVFGFCALVVGRQVAATAVAALVLVATVGLGLLLIPDGGAEAAAWITLTTEALAIALMGSIVLGAFALRPRAGRLPRVVLAAAVMSGVVAALEALGVHVIALAVVAGVVYAATLPALGGISPEDRAVLRGRLRP